MGVDTFLPMNFRCLVGALDVLFHDIFQAVHQSRFDLCYDPMVMSFYGCFTETDNKMPSRGQIGNVSLLGNWCNKRAGSHWARKTVCLSLRGGACTYLYHQITVVKDRDTVIFFQLQRALRLFKVIPVELSWKLHACNIHCLHVCSWI